MTDGLTGRRTVVVAVLLVVVYLVGVCTPFGQQLDNELWAAGQRLPAGFARTVSDFVRTALPVVAGIVLLVHVLVHRRPRTALVAVVAWVLAVGAAYALREVLPRPYLGEHGGFPINSFPSTHVALAATPLVAVLLDRTADRSTTAICVVLIGTAAAGNTLLLVHRASDTVGSVLVAVLVVSALQHFGARFNSMSDTSKS